MSQERHQRNRIGKRDEPRSTTCTVPAAPCWSTRPPARRGRAPKSPLPHPGAVWRLVYSFQEKLQLVRLVPDGKGRTPELHRDGLNALPTKYQCSEFFFFLACPGLWCITHFHFALPNSLWSAVVIGSFGFSSTKILRA